MRLCHLENRLKRVESCFSKTCLHGEMIFENRSVTRQIPLPALTVIGKVLFLVELGITENMFPEVFDVVVQMNIGGEVYFDGISNSSPKGSEDEETSRRACDLYRRWNNAAEDKQELGN